MKTAVLLMSVATCLLFPPGARAAADKPFKPDHLFVVDSGDDIQEFDETGAFVQVLDEAADALAFGPDGLLYVANATLVRALDAKGDVQASFGSGQIDGLPVGMTFGAGGELFVAVAGSEDAVRVFDVANHVLLRSLDISAPLVCPLSLAPDGHVVGTFAATLGAGTTLLQLVEFDASGGQLTPIVLDDVSAMLAGATTFGPDGSQYFTTTTEDKVTVRTSAGSGTAFIGVAAGIDGPTDLAFGPDGNLCVCSFDSNRIVVIDTSGNLVRTLGADSAMNGPLRLAFSPRRFKAKLSGKLVDKNGVTVKLKADAKASLTPGQGTLMLAIDDDTGDSKDFASLFGTTLVFSGHQGAGEAPKTRRLIAACVLDATLDEGFGAVDLDIKGKLGKNDDIFRPSKCSGTLLRAAAGRVFSGKLTTGALIK